MTTHTIITEYDQHLHWWCSCGWDGDDPAELHRHTEPTRGTS